MIERDDIDGCLAVLIDTEAATDEEAELLCLFPGDLVGPVEWLAEQWRELFADGIPAPLAGAYDVCKVIDPETGDARPSMADVLARASSSTELRALAGYDLGLLQRLKAEGVNVVEVAGWRTRGSSTYNPGPHLDHHTGGPGSALNVIINGRPDLPGPLSQTNQHRDGRVFLVAAGRANHAGAGSWKGYTGNSACSGNERDNTGSEPWLPGSHEIAARVAAAQLRGRGASADLYCRHAEWAGPRKPDSHSVTGDHLRALARSFLSGSPGGTKPEPPPPADPPQFGPITVIDHPEENMRSLDFTMPLDGDGNGWRDITVDPAKVISFVVNAADPPAAGYGDGIDVSRLDIGGKTRVVVANGHPRGAVGLTMWVAA